MRKIVLVQLERPDETMFCPPFGLMLLADSLRKHKYEPIIFHKKATEDNLKKLYNISKDSLFVGFSTRTYPNLLFDREVSIQIKKNGGKVVWGGVHATLCPETTMKEDCVDYIILGEAEETIVKLADALKNKLSVKNIPGICYKHANKIKINKRAQLIMDLNKYDFAWDLVDVEKYLTSFEKYKRVLPIITSKGCPHRCGFCYNLNVNERRWRGKSPDPVIKKLKKLKEKYKIDGLLLFDDNFFTNKQRAFQLIEGMNLPYTASIRANYFDDDFAKKLKQTKCIMVFVGAESGSQRSEKTIKRYETFYEVIQIINYLIQKTRKGRFFEKIFFNLFRPVEYFERFRLKYRILFLPIDIYLYKALKVIFRKLR